MEKIIELCPNCGTEQEISRTGGKCKECGQVILPCSLCNMNKVKCNECAFEKDEVITIEGDSYTIVEMDTIYNKYLQLVADSLRDYETMKAEYSLSDFILDLQNNELDYELKTFNSLKDIVQYLYVEDLSKDTIACIIVNMMEASKNGEVSIKDEKNVIILNENTDLQKYAILEEF